LDFGNVYAYGTMKLGMDSIDPQVFDLAEFIISAPDSVLGSVRSDFRIRVHFNLKTDKIPSSLSILIPATVDIGFMDTEKVQTSYNTIWMKVFFPSQYDKADIKRVIYDVYISNEDFNVQIVMPYRYVDEHIITDRFPAKSGTPGIKEKKVGKDAQGGDKTTVEHPVDKVCGPGQTMTYLDYVGFDYMFADNLNRLYGMFPASAKEILFSGVSQIVNNDSYSTGRFISESDMLKRNITQATIAYVGNIGEIVDWKFEEFSLDMSDFEGMALSAEDYDAIDSIFRDSMKYVLNTIGDDVLSHEYSSGSNSFADFPDRPAPDDSLSTKIKVHQFFIVEEENV